MSADYSNSDLSERIYEYREIKKRKYNNHRATEHAEFKKEEIKGKKRKYNNHRATEHAEFKKE